MAPQECRNMQEENSVSIVFTLVHEKVGEVEFDNMQGTNNIKMQVKFIMIHSLTVV